MKKTYIKETPVLLFVALLGLSTAAKAELIGYDLYSGNLNSNLGLTYYQNDAQGAYASSQDGFGKYQSAGANSSAVPDGLIDMSGWGLLDNYGLVMPTENYAFFGITDTVNSSNPAGNSTAEWGFDIGNFSNLSIDIDFAAMGDFESSDTYSLSYAVDDSLFSPLFVFTTEGSLSLNYTMVNGNQRMLNDPLSIRGPNSPFRFNLTNEFTQYSANIGEQGQTLRLRMDARADGGTEAFGFSNIRINGTALADEPITGISEVSEPGTLAIMSLSLLGLFRRYSA